MRPTKFGSIEREFGIEDNTEKTLHLYPDPSESLNFPICCGRLPALKLGRLWRIRPEDLEAFLEGNRAPAQGYTE